MRKGWGVDGWACRVYLPLLHFLVAPGSTFLVTSQSFYQAVLSSSVEWLWVGTLIMHYHYQ